MTLSPSSLKEPLPLIPPVALARFASPHLRFIHLAAFVTNAGEKQKVVLVMQTHLLIASIEGKLTTEALLPNLTAAYRQLTKDFLQETVALAFTDKDKGRKDSFVCIRFTNEGHIAEHFISTICFYAPPDVRCSVVPRNDPDIVVAIARIKKSTISAALKNAKPSPERRAALLQAEAALKAKPPVQAVPPDISVTRERIRAIYEAHAPEKMPTAKTLDDAIRAFAGEEELLIQTLTKKYVPEPPPLPDRQPFQSQRETSSSTPQKDLSATPSMQQQQFPQSPLGLNREPALQNEFSASSEGNFAVAPEQHQIEPERTMSRSASPRSERMQEAQQMDSTGGSTLMAKSAAAANDAASNALMAILANLSQLRVEVGELRNSTTRSVVDLPTEPLPADQWPRGHEADSDYDSASGDGEIEFHHATFISSPRNDHAELRVEHSTNESTTAQVAGPARDKLRSLKHHIDDLGAQHRELLRSATSPARMHEIEAFAKPLRAMRDIVAQFTDEPPAVTQEGEPPLLPAWAIVDFGEPNPNVMPPTTRKYRRLVVFKYIKALNTSSDAQRSTSPSSPSWNECLAICTRGEFAMAEGGWVVPLQNIESVCAGAVSHRVRSKGIYATSVGEFFNDDMTITIYTERTAIIIQFDTERPRILWLKKIRQTLQLRHSEQQQQQSPQKEANNQTEWATQDQAEAFQWDAL